MSDDTKTLVERMRALVEQASPGPWRSMRDGNQYVDTKHRPKARVVGASRVDGLVRPWNPARNPAHVFAEEAGLSEESRFLDADADFIAACREGVPALLERIDELEDETDWPDAHEAQRMAENLAEQWMTKAQKAEKERDDLQKEVERLRAAEDAAGRLLGEVICATTLEDGAQLSEPSEHAAVQGVLRVRAERDKYKALAERRKKALEPFVSDRSDGRNYSVLYRLLNNPKAQEDSPFDYVRDVTVGEVRDAKAAHDAEE